MSKFEGKEMPYTYEEIRLETQNFINENIDDSKLDNQDFMIEFLDEINDFIENKYPGAPFRAGCRIYKDNSQISLYNICRKN